MKKSRKKPAVRPLEELVEFLKRELEALAPTDPEKDERLFGFEIRLHLKTEIEAALTAFQDGTHDKVARNLLHGVLNHLRNSQLHFIRAGFSDDFERELNRLDRRGLDERKRNLIWETIIEGRRLMDSPNHRIDLEAASRLHNRIGDLICLFYEP